MEGWTIIHESRFAEELRAWAEKLNGLLSDAGRRPDIWGQLGGELDRLCAFIACEDNGRLWHRLRHDKGVKEAAERLREVSARALGAVEKARARLVCAQKKWTTDDRYSLLLSASVREEWERVRARRGAKVMFIGAGAFPVSAFTIAREMSAEVLCVDIDEEAVRHAMELARYLELEEKIRYGNGFLCDPEFVGTATHVFIASLVPEKLDILRELRSRVRSDCRIVVRYGNGLKSLFNYPLDTEMLTDWRAAAFGRTGSLHDTLILEPRTTAYEWQNSHFIASGT